MDRKNHRLRDVAEIAPPFGRFDQLGKVLTQLHSLLYAA